jgi:hypothetical protein
LRRARASRLPPPRLAPPQSAHKRHRGGSPQLGGHRGSDTGAPAGLAVPGLLPDAGLGLGTMPVVGGIAGLPVLGGGAGACLGGHAPSLPQQGMGLPALHHPAGGPPAHGAPYIQQQPCGALPPPPSGSFCAVAMSPHSDHTGALGLGGGSGGGTGALLLAGHTSNDSAMLAAIMDQILDEDELLSDPGMSRQLLGSPTSSPLLATRISAGGAIGRASTWPHAWPAPDGHAAAAAPQQQQQHQQQQGPLGHAPHGHPHHPQQHPGAEFDGHLGAHPQQQQTHHHTLGPHGQAAPKRTSSCGALPHGGDTTWAWGAACPAADEAAASSTAAAAGAAAVPPPPFAAPSAASATAAAAGQHQQQQQQQQQQPAAMRALCAQLQQENMLLMQRVASLQERLAGGPAGAAPPPPAAGSPGAWAGALKSEVGL